MDYFANAGRKMGGIINVAFKILLIVCIVAAAAVLIAALCTISSGLGAFLLVLVCGIAAVGVILGLGYLGFLQLAAFAELVENSNLILMELKAEEPEPKPIIRTEEKPHTDKVQAAPEGMRKAITCPKCGKSQFEGRSTCFSCGASLK